MVNATGCTSEPATHPSFELLKPHLEAGHDLIPLKPLSMEPIHFDWPITPPLREDQARAHMASGGNTGVRLRPDMLVIDVNLRETYEGQSPIQRLENSFGISLSGGPLVLTGGGDQHFYFRKPAKCKIRRRLFGFRGLSFKSAISYVLASGSVHPTTREYCRCEILQDVFSDAPEIPNAVLHRMATQGGGFQARRPTPGVFPLSGAMEDSDPSTLLMYLGYYHRTAAGKGPE